MDKLEQKRYDEVKALLGRMNTFTNNTDLSAKQWGEVLQYRMERVEELLETLRTGSTDHIIVDSSYINIPPKVEHFK